MLEEEEKFLIFFLAYSATLELLLDTFLKILFPLATRFRLSPWLPPKTAFLALFLNLLSSFSSGSFINIGISLGPILHPLCFHFYTSQGDLSTPLLLTTNSMLQLPTPIISQFPPDLSKL